jgi:hypothetical protein
MKAAAIAVAMLTERARPLDCRLLEYGRRRIEHSRTAS